jgi:hypothetical protein
VQADFALTNHLQHSCIRHQLSPADICQRLLDGWGLSAFRPTPSAAEDVAGGKMTRAQAVMKESGLGSLTNPGGSQQDKSFGRMLQFWQRLTSGRRALHPGWTIGIHRGSHAKTLGPSRTLCRDENHVQLRVHTHPRISSGLLAQVYEPEQLTGIAPSCPPPPPRCHCHSTTRGAI